jgi:ElaB/YqjD/DUF883 family membrane-anchored ribosome-binding protein
MADPTNNPPPQEPPVTPKKTTRKPRAAKPAEAATPADSAVVEARPSKGEEVRAKVKSNVDEIRTKATEGAKAAAVKGKDRATEAVGSIGKLIRDSAATIDENVGKQYGDYARGAAETVEGFANKLEAKDVEEILEDARQFVRKSPAVAVGAAAAIGFVLARLVRSGGKDA